MQWVGGSLCTLYLCGFTVVIYSGFSPVTTCDTSLLKQGNYTQSACPCGRLLVWTRTVVSWPSWPPAVRLGWWVFRFLFRLWLFWHLTVKWHHCRLLKSSDCLLIGCEGLTYFTPCSDSRVSWFSHIITLSVKFSQSSVLGLLSVLCVFTKKQNQNIISFVLSFLTGECT